MVNNKIFDGQELSCKITSQNRCLNCNYSAKRTFDYDSENPIIKRNVCKMKQKATDFSLMKSLNLQVSTKLDNKRFVMFNDRLQQYIIENELKEKSDDEHEDHFLMKPNVKITNELNADIVIFLQ